MKKNISINIGGIIFHIEEDGYEKLKNYLDSVNSYFSAFEDSKEIIEDIEGRIAEIFLGKLDDGKQIINIEDIDDLIQTMGTTKDFDANIDTEPEVEPQPQDSEPETEPEPEKTKRLYRDKKRVVIGGVASGLGHYLSIDPIWIRLILLAALFNIGFWGISGFVFIAYIVLWIAVPGSSELSDDKKIKKLFRSSDDSVLGGVAGGLASYFGTDPVLIRVLFVVAIFAGGAGILVYIILWIITPLARTLTEKMQMQGEPVTISNIEENVKKSLNVKEGEETPFVKILLFPFRLVAIIFKALGESLGPILRFAVEALRVITGVFLVILGFVLTLSATIALAVLMGIGGAWDYYTYFGPFSPNDIAHIMGVLGMIASYFALLIPSIALILIGVTIIIKRGVVKSFVSWSLFGVWSISVLVLAFTLPSIFNEFRVDNNYREEKTIQVAEDIPTLRFNKLDTENFNRVELKLRGHGDTLNYKLLLDFESRGSNLPAARDNAEAVDYQVYFLPDEISFDSDINFQETPFRFQSVEATLYIPYGKTFRMDDDLRSILRNTLYPHGYKASQMEGNDWVFTKEGLKCVTCREEEEKNTYYNGDAQTYGFEDFDEVKLSSQFDFEIIRSNQYSVELIGDEDRIEDIILEQHGDELEIKHKRSMKWWDANERDNIKLIITMPELEYLEITGASEGEVRDFTTREMEIRLTGASELMAEIDPEELRLEATGASEVRLKGRVRDLDISLTGASELNAYTFEADRADVKAIGASTAKVTVNEYLNANAAGASSVRYRGNPEVNYNAVGMSTVKGN